MALKRLAELIPCQSPPCPLQHESTCPLPHDIVTHISRRSLGSLNILFSLCNPDSIMAVGVREGGGGGASMDAWIKHQHPPFPRTDDIVYIEYRVLYTKSFVVFQMRRWCSNSACNHLIPS